MPRSVVVLLDNAEGRGDGEGNLPFERSPVAEFQELVQAEVEQTGKQRRAGLWGLLRRHS